MRARGRGTVIAILMLLLAFGVGGLAGMAVEEALGLDWFDFFEDQRAPTDRLLAGLDLTPDQRERVDEVLERQEDRLEDYWEARLPEIRRLLDESYAEIRSMLTPAQQEIFDRRVRELDGRVPAELRDD